MKRIAWTAALLTLASTLAHAQFGGYRYNNHGQLVDGRGQPANVHQELHDMANPALWTTGAVAVSNTVDPNFTQADLATIEGAIAPNPEPGGLAMSRLYLTPTNPYTPGTGVQSGSPVGYNHDHYNQILIDAPASGYVATQSGAYIARTHPGSSSEIFNRGFNTYEANPKFQAALSAAGGQGGGVVFFVNQSSESFAHLRAISGSNVFMTAYVRPPSGGVITLGGQVVLNEQHNTVSALDTSQYGPAFVAGVSQIQGQTLATGNEAGFWVTGTGSNTQIADWGDGSADSIAAAYDPDAQFHVHTHPGTSGPSYTDFLASALLGGMPGMVASGSGNYAYGFQVEGGWLPAADGGVVVFGDVGWGSERPAAADNSGIGGRDKPQSIASSIMSSLGFQTGTPDYNSEPQNSSLASRFSDFAFGTGGYVGRTEQTEREDQYKTPTQRYEDCITDFGNVIAAGSNSTFVADCAIQAAIDSGTSAARRDPNFGGPRSDRAYSESETAYGGSDGNTAPDGSAINGF